MKNNASLEKNMNLWLAARSGDYPEGTTAEELAKVVFDDKLVNYVSARGYSAPGNAETALHVAALNRHLPPGTTPRVLINAKACFGFTALHAAASTGMLPLETTVSQLIQTQQEDGTTALHFVPRAKPYFKGVTVGDLIDAKNCIGWSALHESAMLGNFLEGTTMQDLLTCRDHFGDSAFAQLPENLAYHQIKPVLDATIVSSLAELKQLGNLIAAWNSAIAASWLSDELRRLTQLNQV